MRKFNNEFLQRVKDSTNLIDVIRAYGIDVKKKGSRYWACCPFHHEKTPSFSISPEDGFYYCFGCHESGDSIKFIEKMDQITFPDAVERLAEWGMWNCRRMKYPKKIKEKQHWFMSCMK